MYKLFPIIINKKTLFLNGLLIFSCAALGDDYKKYNFHDVALSPGWAGTIHISKNNPQWNKEKYFLTVSPTIKNDKIYVPYDFSDAWHELDAMLPQEYVSEILGNISEGSECSIKEEKLEFVHVYLTFFLAHYWLSIDDSRLYKFFDNFYSAHEDSVISEEKNKNILSAITLCAYYKYKRMDQYPDSSEFINQYKQAIRFEKKRK
ncbi:MAG: hypothetical protein H0W44_07140 [Gammaproteobacteria bacterium]|nr:hypothetical protein [Gammaproteobacteria bacterium]